MKTIIRLLTEILSELRHICCSLEKQNTPDVQDRECEACLALEHMAFKVEKDELEKQLEEKTSCCIFLGALSCIFGIILFISFIIRLLEMF